MKVKNLNPLERHVEKIVLGAAVLGAAYLVYTGLQPTVITTVGEKTLEVTQVESAITEALTKVQAKADELEKKPIKRDTKDYAADVRRASQTPLDQKLIAALPRFGPLQVSATAVGKEEVDPLIVVTPSVPKPLNVEIAVGRGVITPVPPAVVPGQPVPPVAPEPQDLNFVRIAGYFPEAEFRAMLTREGDPAKKTRALSPDRQALLAYYRVEVQRRTRSVAGVSVWQNVLPTRAQPAPLDLRLEGAGWEQARDAASLLMKPETAQAIMQPKFHEGVTVPPLPAPPAPKVAPVPAGGGRGPGGRPVAPVVPPAGGELFAPPPLAGAGGGAPGHDHIPFWFFDETVQPGEAYEYQVRIVMFNPTYQFPLRLDKEELKDKPFIASDWIPAGMVEIKGNLHFFFSVGMSQTSARIYKFSMGQWWAFDTPLSIGSAVGGPGRAIGKNQMVDFSTGYTLVDVTQAGTNNYRIVLLSPSGQLVTRSTAADAVNADRQQIEKEFRDQGKPKGPTAAAGGRPGAPGAVAPGE